MKRESFPALLLVVSMLLALGALTAPRLHAQEVYPWGVTRIGADIVHGYPNLGGGVKVAILDTGIDVDHPDLFVTGGINVHDDDGDGNIDYDDNWDDEEYGDGYGTALAGIVAALSSGVGVIGVAPDVELYAVRVRSYDSVSYTELLPGMTAGINWCIDPDDDGDTSDKMDVLCLGPLYSWLMYTDLPDYYPELRAACDAAWDAGIVLVVGAGGYGTASGKGDIIWGVGRYDSVIAVGATDKGDKRWSSEHNIGYSATGPDLELMAPGDEITTTLVGGGYGFVGPYGRFESAISLAAAHVAGTAALVIAGGISDANGDGRISDEVRQRLIDTADDLGDPGFDWKFGYGIVDADEAAPAGPVNQPPIVAITSPPDGFVFASGASVEFTGTASDPENGDLTDGLVWTSSINGQIGTGGSFSATLSDGTHTITASVTDFGGATGINSVTITVGDLTRLNVVVATDKTGYWIGETVYITVTVTNADTGALMQGAAVHIDILTPKAKHYTRDGITNDYGVVEFTFKPKIPDGEGIYSVTATASKAGCEPGSGGTAFNAVKPY